MDQQLVDDVRLIIGDLDNDTERRLLTDQQISRYLTLNVSPSGNETAQVKRAAAAALETIATSEALLSKKIRTQDRSTDGPAVADALRKHAWRLRQEADQAEGQDSFFEISTVTERAPIEGEETRCPW